MSQQLPARPASRGVPEPKGGPVLAAGWSAAGWAAAAGGSRAPLTRRPHSKAAYKPVAMLAQEQQHAVHLLLSGHCHPWLVHAAVGSFVVLPIIGKGAQFS